MTEPRALIKGVKNGSQVLRSTVVFLILCAVPLIFILTGLSAWQSGFMLLATWSLLMLVLSTWSIGASLIAVPLEIYLTHHYGKGNYAAIDVVYSRSLRIVNKLPLRRTWAMAMMLSNLALMRLCQGSFDSAEALFRQAVTYVRKDKQLSRHYYSAILLNNLAVACLKQQNFIEAELLATEAMEVMELPKNKGEQLNVIRALINAVHGLARLEHGELPQAESHLKNACRLHESDKISNGLSSITRKQAHVAAYFGLALVYARQDRLEQSESACDRAYTLMAEECSLNLLSVHYLNLLANEYMNKQLFDRAERLLELAYAIGGNYPFHTDAQDTLSYFEKLFLLTQRHHEVADMRKWLRPVAGINGVPE